MKISELVLLTEESASKHQCISNGVFGLSVYGVTVDSNEDITPPTWLKEIGIILQINDQGEIDEDVLDIALSYRLAKINVMLEIPFTKEGVNEEYLLAYVATNMSMSLSFLPPEDKSEESFQEYLEQTRRVCAAFFKKPNIDRMVMPITNYLEYLFVHIINPEKDFKVRDSYVISSYAEDLGEERVNILKDVIREETYKFYGGKEQFEAIAKEMMMGIYDEAVKITHTARENLIENRKKNADENSKSNRAKEDDPRESIGATPQKSSQKKKKRAKSKSKT